MDPRPETQGAGGNISRTGALPADLFQFTRTPPAASKEIIPATFSDPNRPTLATHTWKAGNNPNLKGAEK